MTMTDFDINVEDDFGQPSASAAASLCRKDKDKHPLVTGPVEHSDLGAGIASAAVIDIKHQWGSISFNTRPFYFSGVPFVFLIAI